MQIGIELLIKLTGYKYQIIFNLIGILCHKIIAYLNLIFSNFRLQQWYVYVCIFDVLRRVNILGHRRLECLSIDDYDDQMIFGGLVGLKFLDICLTGEEKPRKNLSQETCPDRGSNPGPLRDRHACYRLLHSDGLQQWFENGLYKPKPLTICTF